MVSSTSYKEDCLLVSTIEHLHTTRKCIPWYCQTLTQLSLVPRPLPDFTLPNFPLPACHAASYNGELGEGLGTKLLVSTIEHLHTTRKDTQPYSLILPDPHPTSHTASYNEELGEGLGTKLDTPVEQ